MTEVTSKKYYTSACKAHELWLLQKEIDGEVPEAKRMRIKKKILRDPILANYNLSEASFYKCGLVGIKCNGTNLRASHFHACSLTDGIFFNCCLKRASFKYCNMTGTSFLSCDFDDAGKFEYAHLENAVFYNCKISGRLRFDGAVIKGTSFVGCNLSNTSFEAARIIGPIYMDSRSYDSLPDNQKETIKNKYDRI